MALVYARLREYGIFPDVISYAPETLDFLAVSYPSGAEVNLGDELTPTQAMRKPTIRWEADPNSQYCLLFVDPDAPSKINPKKHTWKHWLVVNIPGNQVEKGHTELDYLGCGPPEGSGLHRYIFLLFKQSKNFSTDSSSSSFEVRGRVPFDTKQFIKKNNLELKAANFFQAQHDDSVKDLVMRLMKCPYIFPNLWHIVKIKLFY